MNPGWLRAAVLALFALTAAVGTLTLVNRREFDLNYRWHDGKAVVSALSPRGRAAAAGLQVGDALLSVRGMQLDRPAAARWALVGIFTGHPVPFVIGRGDETIRLSIPPIPALHPLLVALNTVLGLTFILVGLVVWWHGCKSSSGSAGIRGGDQVTLTKIPAQPEKGADPTVKTFFALTSLAGVSILLFSHENPLRPVIIHFAYSLLWLGAYSLVPAALVHFLLNFTRPQAAYRRYLPILIYTPAILTFGVLSILYVLAYHTRASLWMETYESAFNTSFTALLLVYFTVAVVLLIRAYIRPDTAASRDRVRWLAICTVGGLAPFFLLFKAPALFGWKPLIPLAAALGFMLIVPLGWGMAVASFRMFRLEWALSRATIHAAAVVILLCLVGTAAAAGAGFSRAHQPFAFAAITFVVAGVVIYWSLAGLIRSVEWILDRLYFRDWFDYRLALRQLGEELSRSITEPEVVGILARRLPELLKVDKAALVIRSGQGGWMAHQAGGAAAGSNGGLLQITGRLTTDGWQDGVLKFEDDPEFNRHLSAWGCELAVQLKHSSEVVGLLLLGGKTSGASFSVRDRALLEPLSTHAGAALANIALTRRLLDNEKRSLAIDMAGGVAHEIKNALSPLMGQAQMLDLALSGNADLAAMRPAGERLEVILNMCRRISRIASDLGRIAEPLRCETTTLLLNEVAEETVRIMSETAGRIKRFNVSDDTAQYRLIGALDPHLPPVKGDAQQLGQVFMNLLINAADAVESMGGGCLTIGTRRNDDQTVTGYVADTGPGIAPEFLGKVFQPYFTTKPRGKGTGLGLAVVRSIVEAHGGKVSILPEHPQGVRMEFTLPAV